MWTYVYDTLLSICHPSCYNNTYLRRYEWPWRLTTRRNRRRPPWPWALDVTRSRTAEDGRHPGWDWHSDRHRTHRMHHYSGIDKWWHRMSWMDWSRRPADSSLRIWRWRWCIWWSGPEGTRCSRRIRSSWPATRRHVTSSGWPRRMLLRHFGSLQLLAVLPRL